jgi:hypothetical protein
MMFPNPMMMPPPMTIQRPPLVPPVAVRPMLTGANAIPTTPTLDKPSLPVVYNEPPPLPAESDVNTTVFVSGIAEGVKDEWIQKIMEVIFS